MVSVIKAHSSLIICGKRKIKDSVVVRGKLLPELPHPAFKSPVRTDFSLSVQDFKIFVCDPERDIDLHILFLFIEIRGLYPVLPLHGAQSVKDRCFPNIIPPHQDQGVLNVPDLQIADKSEIPDMNPFNSHAFPPCGAYERDGNHPVSDINYTMSMESFTTGSREKTG